MPYKKKIPSVFVSVLPSILKLTLLQSTSTPYFSFTVINNSMADVQTSEVRSEIYKFN